MSLVANLNHGQSYFGKSTVYIGRKSSGMHFGNPFSFLPLRMTKAAVKVENRAAAIEAFRNWLNGTAYQDAEPKRRQWILDNLHLLKDKDVLLCYCAPEACHGDIYNEMLERI